MSVRSKTEIWVHLIWGTYKREKSLPDKELRKKLSQYINNYSKDKNIITKAIYVNSDHVHALIILPTNKTIEDIFHLLKGSSSHWVNQQVRYKFSWAKGYAAFSVSELHVINLINYIKNQGEHHSTTSFADEYNKFLKEAGNL